MPAPNYYSWLNARRYGTAAMDASPDWDENKVKRTAKGGKGGGGGEDLTSGGGDGDGQEGAVPYVFPAPDFRLHPTVPDLQFHGRPRRRHF